MKKTGIMNSIVASVVSEMGHMDLLVIGDAGLPVPLKPRRIDLAVDRGIPSFIDVCINVLKELKVEKAYIALEMKTENPGIFNKVKELLPEIEIIEFSHTEFKEKTAEAVAIIRTGECSPYANIILQSGVIF